MEQDYFQQVLNKYRWVLPILQKEIQPRGVWSSTGNPPVYYDGLHAFRCIERTYLREFIAPQDLKKIVGRTRIISLFNAVFFGRIKELCFLIKKEQEDQFSRLVVRLFLIDQLRISVIDYPRYQGKNSVDKAAVIDLRALPLNLVRKLLRWKKQYSPAFDGMVTYDRIDEIIADPSSPSTLHSAVYVDKGIIPKPVKRYRFRTTKTKKWTHLLNKSQTSRFVKEEVLEIQQNYYDYQKWILFTKDLVAVIKSLSKSYLQHTLKIAFELDRDLIKCLESLQCVVKYYPIEKTTWIIPPRKTGNKLAWIRSKLQCKVMLKILLVLVDEHLT